MFIIMIVFTRLNLPVLYTTAQLTKVFVNWSMVIRLDFFCIGNFVWRKQRVNDYREWKCKNIYIYYHYYCFSNVQRSIQKWYIIAIRIDIIFCRCGGTEDILMVPHPPFRTFFSAGSASSIQHRKCGSAPVRGAVVRKCIPLLIMMLWFCCSDAAFLI